VPTATSVKVKFGASTASGFVASAVKKVTLTLPQGLSLSGQIASGASGLPLCTATEFDQTGAEHNACPDATSVGTVSFKSPLLTDPLTGNAYLGPQSAPGALPDLYIEAQLGTASDAPRVKLVGKLSINADNQVVTTLDDLPELLVSEFDLTFRGGDNSVLTTPPTCGSFSGALSAYSYAAPTAGVDSTVPYAVTADCDVANTFAPSVAFSLANTQAGGSSPLTSTVSRPDRTQRLGNVAIDLPAGMLATLKGVPECAAADAAAGNCPASTQVGTLSTLAGVGPAPFNAPGTVYLTARQGSDVAGLEFKVPVVFGEVNLGTLNVPARVQIRSNDLGLRVLADVPTRFSGIPLNIRSLAITLNRAGFPLSPTSCSALSTTSTITSADGTVAQATAGLQATGCASLKFAPQLTAAVNGATGNLHRPNVQVRITIPQGDSAMKQTYVTLPQGLAVDLTQLGRACTLADFQATTCADSAKIGKVSGALSIAAEPLAGDLYLLKPPAGQALPGIGLAFKGRFAGNVAGSSTISKTGQIVTQFPAVPDLPLTALEIDLAGGTGGLLQATKPLCTSASVEFTGHFVAQSGPVVDRTEKTVCGAVLGSPLAPAVNARASHLKTGKPTFALTASAAKGAGKIKALGLTLPTGWNLDTKRAHTARNVPVRFVTANGTIATRRLSPRRLSVKLPSGGSSKVRLVSRTNTITLASKKLRKSKSTIVFALTVTYASGKKIVVPVVVTPR
jgi:hypothetical protein